VMEFDNIETVKRAVEIDAGVAIVPRATIEQEVKNQSLAALEFKGQPFFRPLGILTKSGRVLSPAVRRFLEVLTEKEKAA
jgi:DNA-binding transcriptional LysR family regulator